MHWLMSATPSTRHSVSSSSPSAVTFEITSTIQMAVLPALSMLPCCSWFIVRTHFNSWYLCYFNIQSHSPHLCLLLTDHIVDRAAWDKDVVGFIASATNEHCITPSDCGKEPFFEKGHGGCMTLFIGEKDCICFETAPDGTTNEAILKVIAAAKLFNLVPIWTVLPFHLSILLFIKFRVTQSADDLCKGSARNEVYEIDSKAGVNAMNLSADDYYQDVLFWANAQSTTKTLDDANPVVSQGIHIPCQ